MNTLISGVGIGLRAPHYQTILSEQPNVPWFEVLTDNYMNPGGSPLFYLEKIHQLYPITFHGVGLSLGGTEPLNNAYLSQLKSLIKSFQPQWISDHLCWTHTEGLYSNDLLPLPYTEEALAHIVSRIQQVQDYLGQRILVENVSSYLTATSSIQTEWEFLSEVIKQADCYLLLDINNIYVSAFNHQFDPSAYLAAIPTERVKEMHLAGFEDMQTHYLDTHGKPVHEGVWCLYKQALKRLPNVPTLIEWDTDIPEWEVLYAEKLKADEISQQVNPHVAA